MKRNSFLLADNGLYDAKKIDVNQAARDILARGEFDVEAGIMYIRYDGHKATVVGGLTEDGWQVRCESMSASCTTPRAAFEEAVMLRIERNHKRNQATRLAQAAGGAASAFTRLS